MAFIDTKTEFGVNLSQLCQSSINGGKMKQYLTESEIERIQTEFKIPVGSSHPNTGWIASLYANSVMPTDLELEQIRSFTAYLIKKTYNEKHAEILGQMPLAQESWHDTTILFKGPDSTNEQGWFYRRKSWGGDGPTYVPDPCGENYRPLSLVEIMDMHEKVFATTSEKWIAWKEKHCDVFPASQPVHVE